MSETQAATTQTSGSGVAVEPVQSYEATFEERSAAVFGNDPVDVPTAPKSAGEAAAAPAADPPAEASPAVSEDEATKARRERLAKLAANEAASVDAHARRKEQDELRQRLAAAEKRADEAERMAALRIDPATIDERSFFEHAAKAKVTPQRLGEWLREQTENPELAVSRTVDSALTPKLTEWEKRIADKEAKLDAIIQQQEDARIEREESAAFHEFSTFASSNATTSPYTAAFLRECGPQEFRKVVVNAASRLPANAGPQALLDSLEENFAKLARIYAAPAAAAKASTPQPNPGAAKPMTTVSNTLAQTRASVVDEDAEWASLPFEERSRRLFHG